MDRRVRERRRLVSRARGGRRASLIFLGILAVAAAVLFLWLRSSDVFAVTEVSAPATHHITQGEIADAVSPARGVSLLKVSTGAVAKRLEASPYVRSVQVYRDFPHSLEIRLVEYEPVARVRAGDGKVWLVADDGRLLEKIGTEAPSPLPLVVPAAHFVAQPAATAPPGVLGALQVVLTLQTPDMASRLPAIDEISVSTGGQVVVHLQGGTQLRLGDPTDLKQKITVAADIIQEYLRDGKTVEYVDASAEGRVAVKAE